MQISRIKIIIFFLSLFSFDAQTSWRSEIDFSRPDHSIRLNHKNKGYRYISDPSINWKIKFGYGPLKISYSEPIKGTKLSGKSIPGANYQDLEVKLYLNNLLIEYIYKEYQGFFTDDENVENCNSCEIRNDLISKERTYQLFYALNPDFDLKNIVSVADNGVDKFQFSFLILGGGTRWKLISDNTIFRGDVGAEFSDLNESKEIRINQYFSGLGAGVIVPFGKFHFSSFLSIAAGLYELNVRKLDGEKVEKNNKLGTNINLKANFGTHGDGWNTGLKGIFLSNQYKIDTNKTLLSIDYELLTYLSYSF